jgi:hypothetical protein
LDLSDKDQLAELLKQLYLPALTRLYLPLVTDSLAITDDSESDTGLVAAFLERHQGTLLEYHLLNAAEVRNSVRVLWPKVNTWLKLEELRIDLEQTEDYYHELEPGLEWTLTREFLGLDGKDNWGRHIRRARLDRFNFTNIHQGFMFDFTWQSLRHLVLNPLFPWSRRLFLDPNEPTGPRIRESERKQILGASRPDRKRKPDEEVMAGEIVSQMGHDNNNLRIISIGDFRFWVEPSNQKIWYLRDAFEDEVQYQQIRQQLTRADWDFLSEQTSVISERGANTATFFRTLPLKSP